MKFIDEIRVLGKGLDGPLAALCDEVIADLSEKLGKTPARVIGIPCTHDPDDGEFDMQLGDELIQEFNSHLAGSRFVFSAEHFSNPFDWQKEIARTVAVAERAAKVLGGQVKLDPSKFDKPDLAMNRCLMHLQESDPALVIAGLDSEAGQTLSGVLGHQIVHGLVLPPGGRRLHRLSQEARTRVTCCAQHGWRPVSPSRCSSAGFTLQSSKAGPPDDANSTTPTGYLLRSRRVPWRWALRPEAVRVPLRNCCSRTIKSSAPA